MNEKLIEHKLTRLVQQNSGLSLKFMSPGFDGVPDRLLLFPGGKAAFVEVKTTGKKPRPLQLYRHEMLRNMGFKVFVLDDVEQIDEIIEEMKMSTIKLKNGEVESVFDRPDLLKSIETHMGYEAMRLVEEYFDDLDGTIAELDEEIDTLKTELEELRKDV